MSAKAGEVHIARKYAEKMLGCASDAVDAIPQPNFRALRCI